MDHHDCLRITAGDPLLDSHGPLAASALRWQQLGMAVLGLRYGTKYPHPAYGPGPGGVLWATRDSRMVPWLWGQDKMAGIAVATGQPSRLLVIDLDVKHGHNGASEWIRQFGGWPAPSLGYPLVSTPSGGWHIYARTDRPVPTRPGILPGVDAKADGGYVVVPPARVWTDSALASDGTAGRVLLPYRMVSGCPCTVPYAPGWLLDWIMSAPGGHQPGSTGDEVDLAGVTENGLPAGARNISLHRLACSLFRRYGTSAAGVSAARATISEVLGKTDRAGFGDSEAERAIGSARRWAAERERQDQEAYDDWMNRR